MTQEPNPTKETEIVPVTPETTEMKSASTKEDEIKKATEALLEAIKKLAASEMQTAGDFSREAYVKAVSRARETIEQIKLIKPEEIEKTVNQVQTDADKNWQGVLDDMRQFGDRLTKAAQTAWEILTNPPKDEPPKS
ncbi:MAG TPA: hypothetical protein IGS52_22690 [Oscillatoriaceae cyanobacterium M33_DOE_052]|uniref:Uncharacterized protein n=1 Tax=Planktothricoides sp. SpSt-374 TaxID=2282167 RepID=A0A7C3ZQA7_9CYAN|nr:hypothetical protein [Oscillatoriaceae cyanobacterium M33_DOE_052]